MQFETDPSSGDLQLVDALTQLVACLRAGVSIEALNSSPTLLNALSEAGVISNASDRVEASRRILEIVQRTPGKVGTALRLMTKVDVRTHRILTTRQSILLEMGQVLDTRTNSKGLSARRVEQLERLMLAPFVASALGLLDEVKFDRALMALPVSGEIIPRQLPVFVQYCNPELFRVLGYENVLLDKARIVSLLDSATRLALLITDNVVLFPVTYIFEVNGFAEFLSTAGPAREMGLLGFVSPSPDLEEARAAKEPEYEIDPKNPYGKSGKSRNSAGLIWRPRKSHTTANAISVDWMASTEENQGPIAEVAMLVAKRLNLPRDAVVKEFSKIPQKLEEQAFIGRHVRAFLQYDLTPSEMRSVELFLSDSYIRSYLGDLNASILVDFPIGSMRTSSDSARQLGQRIISVSTLRVGLARLGLDRYLLGGCHWSEFLDIRRHPMLGFIIDAIAFRAGDPVTERAIAELSRFRRPTHTIESRSDVERVLEIVGNAIIT
jgi:hypothetical protein